MRGGGGAKTVVLNKQKRTVLQAVSEHGNLDAAVSRAADLDPTISRGAFLDLLCWLTDWGYATWDGFHDGDVAVTDKGAKALKRNTAEPECPTDALGKPMADRVKRTEWDPTPRRPIDHCDVRKELARAINEITHLRQRVIRLESGKLPERTKTKGYC